MSSSTAPTSPPKPTCDSSAALDGKRVLELGCGGGPAAVAMARQGAKVIAVDPSAEQIGHARRLSEREDVTVEWHQGDLADLAFVRGDTVDVVLSVYVLGIVGDLDRVFRQVHRVLKPDARFVISLPHPGVARRRARRPADLGPGVLGPLAADPGPTAATTAPTIPSPSPTCSGRSPGRTSGSTPCSSPNPSTAPRAAAGGTRRWAPSRRR